MIFLEVRTKFLESKEYGTLPLLRTYVYAATAPSNIKVLYDRGRISTGNSKTPSIFSAKKNFS